MAEGGDERDIGIARIDDDFADGARVAQADVLPGLAAVHGLVDAVALRDVAAQAGFSRADVQNIWIGHRHGEAANGGRAFLVEDRGPGQSAVGRLKDTAAGASEVVGGGIPGDAGCRERTAAAKGSDQAIFHAFEGGILVL